MMKTKEELKLYIALALAAGEIHTRERDEDEEWMLIAGELPEIFMLNELSLSDTAMGLDDWKQEFDAKPLAERAEILTDLYLAELGTNMEMNETLSTFLRGAFLESTVFKSADKGLTDNPTKTENDMSRQRFDKVGTLFGKYDVSAEIHSYLTLNYPMRILDKTSDDCCRVDTEYGSATFNTYVAGVLHPLQTAAHERALAASLERLHENLYEEYQKSDKDGYEAVSGLSFDEWLETAYPDEGYFQASVHKYLGKFLIENDPLLNLNYLTMYDNEIKAFTKLPADVEMIDENDGVVKFAVTNFENEDVTKMIDRSCDMFYERVSELYDIDADDYDEFYEIFMSYFGEELGVNPEEKVKLVLDFNGDEPKVYAELLIEIPETDDCSFKDFDVTNIPLSEPEQAVVMPILAKAYERETETQLDIRKTKPENEIE